MQVFLQRARSQNTSGQGLREARHHVRPQCLRAFPILRCWRPIQSEKSWYAIRLSIESGNLITGGWSILGSMLATKHPVPLNVASLRSSNRFGLGGWQQSRFLGPAEQTSVAEPVGEVQRAATLIWIIVLYL